MEDEVDRSSPSRKKLKFKPKPPRRQRRPTVSKTEEVNDDKRSNEDEEAAQAQMLIHKFNENLRRHVPKEKKPQVQVAFGPGAPSPPLLIRKYNVPGHENTGSRWSGTEDTMDDDGKIPVPPSAARVDGAINPLPLKGKKQYKEPWEYHHIYYPNTLPLRPPYSGDPKLLDEAEFGEEARNLEYDETTINPASDLGLLEECDNERLFFFQVPEKLPFLKRSASAKGKENAKGKEKAEMPMPSESKSASRKTSFEELPRGYMGKMLVYRSGAIKLKLGDALYDVSPGSECTFAQEVMAINTAGKDCCAIGELGKRAVVTPDIEFNLNSVINLD
ncbi:DNA-directed RNA polymerase III [Salix suchowensis]|nr:DNA-directed RNA polymerase III [Salix suchowensis]